MRRIYGLKRVVEGVYQRLMNSEVQKRLQGEDIVKAKKTQRLLWYGHMKRMGEQNREESDRVETRLYKSKRKTEKPMAGMGIGRHKMAKNPQLDGEDPGSEVHGRGSQRRQR